jgi:hypothetical protein
MKQQRSAVLLVRPIKSGDDGGAGVGRLRHHAPR